MHIVHVFVRVKPEHIDDFRQATIENATNSRREPGIARFDVIQQADDPSRFVLVEVYRNVDATARHKETAHYHAWIARVGDMMAEPRTRTIYTNVDPADEGWL
jgi:(4S)-4-hydroxy-5-phosphonooxypentane-2,3-dione isomerase